MAIDNREQLKNTQKKLARLELTLEEMKQTESPAAYAILSQGFISQIEQMRDEIDCYLNIAEKETEEALTL